MTFESILFIVEGKTDRQRLLTFLPGDAQILCTNGTIDEEALLDLLEPYEHLNFVTLFDVDKNGEHYRKLMKRIYPEAIQLVIPTQYREVAETPVPILQELIASLPKSILQ